MTTPVRLTPARLAIALVACATLLATTFAVALFLGVEHDTAGGARLAWLDPSTPSGRQIFSLARLPRALAATMAGAGLAAAGVAFQSLLRNPLAEPYTLGVSSGAALGAVLAIRLGLEPLFGTSGIAVFAFAGSLAVTALVWQVSRVGRSHPPATLLLAGVTLAFMCSSATMFIQYTASFAESYRIVRWMMGGLDWIALDDLARAAVPVALGLLALLVSARDLNALAAGPDAAASVGVSVDRATGVVFGAASLIVGAVVSVAGPLGFVGIVVPHVLRALIGPDHRALVPLSILGGAAFVLACDTFARIVIAPMQLPAGVITALVGGPFFLAILLGEKGRSRLWGGGA